MEKKQVKKSTKRKVEPRVPSKVSLLDKRMIFLGRDIDELHSEHIIEELLKLDSMKSKEDITFYINSSGGSVSAGMAILDTMNYVKSDIKTVCIGHCASMAAVLLSAGAKGKRFIMPNAECMIHEVSAGTFGKVEKMKIDFEHSKIVNERLLQILADNTGQTLEQIKDDTKSDKWLSANESIAYGLCDEILRNE